MNTRRIFSGKTLETFRDELTAYIEREIDGVDINQASELSALVLDIMGFGVENISYGIDNAINEAFLATARYPNSIDQIANTFDYPQSGASSASGELRLRPSDPPPGTVTLDKGFQFEAENGYTYITTEKVTWQQGSRDFKSVNLAEGEERSVTFRGDGSFNQKKRFSDVEPDEYIRFQSLDLQISNEDWEEVRSLDEQSGSAYRVSYITNPPYVEFGDGIAGNIPSEGAEIFVEYVVNHGAAGNIGSAGKITNAIDSVSVQGRTIDFEFDTESGIMTGGSDSEDLRSVKTNAPKYLHADKAVVVDDDFDALTDSFQDPVLGTVAKAKAFRVDEYEKDLETVSKARFARKRIDDSVTLSESGVEFLSNLLDEFEVFPDSALETSISGQTYEDLVEFIEESGLLESYFDQMDSTIDDIRRIRLEAEAVLAELENIPTRVTNDANDIDNQVAQIQQEIDDSDTISTPTKNTIENHLDAIESSTSEIRTSVSSNLIGRRVQEVITKIDTLVSEYDTLLQNRSSLDATLTQLQRYVSGFRSNLVDQGDKLEGLIDESLEGTSDETGFKELVERLKEARDRLNGLRDHLSEIYESECGPNLITVPILTYDEDDFFATPSLGLINSLEDYLEERSEPSVVINVTDGSDHIVRPAIDVYFKSKTNFSDLDVRERIKERLLSNLRDRNFGQNLYLGGREGVHEFGDNIQGIDFINFEITGHLPANPPAWMNSDQSDIEPRPNVEIDGQGNLLIPDKNIISRPIDPDTGDTLLRFFVKQSPTDTPQQI